MRAGGIRVPSSLLCTPIMNTDGYVLLARLVRPQGRHGELLAEILTDFPRRFAERTHVFLRGPDGTKGSLRPAEIERHWPHGGRVVLKFKGIDSINDAETLRGLDVTIPAEERTPLEEDAVYIGDLMGCHLIDVASGSEIDLGEITAVYRQTVTADILQVTTTAGKELLIPFAKAYLQRVNLPARQVVMSLPEGLVSINTPDFNAPDPDAEQAAGHPHNTITPEPA